MVQKKIYIITLNAKTNSQKVPEFAVKKINPKTVIYIYITSNGLYPISNPASDLLQIVFMALHTSSALPKTITSYQRE